VTAYNPRNYLNTRYRKVCCWRKHKPSCSRINSWLVNMDPHCSNTTVKQVHSCDLYPRKPKSWKNDIWSKFYRDFLKRTLKDFDIINC
jgi:hypothetical protein